MTKNKYTGVHVGGCGRNILFDKSGLTSFVCRSGGRGEILSTSGGATGYKIDYAGKVLDVEGKDTGYTFKNGQLHGPSDTPPWAKDKGT